MAVPFFVFAVLCLVNGDAAAAEMDNAIVVQISYGRMVMSNSDPQVEGGDYHIDLMGAAVQKPLGGDLFKYGFETAGLLNWQSEIRSFAASGGGGGSVYISVDIESFLFDYSAGGYVSFEPMRWLRLYLGAGPLLIFGYRSTQEDGPDNEAVITGSESGLSGGVYGKAGLDVILGGKVLMGGGVRGTRTGLSFEEKSGSVDIEGLQYFVAVSFFL